MENASLPCDVRNNVTSYSSDDKNLTLYLANIRHLSVKVVYIIIGTVGVLDNLFVIVIFFMFVKITHKVLYWRSSISFTNTDINSFSTLPSFYINTSCPTIRWVQLMFQHIRSLVVSLIQWSVTPPDSKSWYIGIWINSVMICVHILYNTACVTIARRK